jgi:hypothetical protein
VLDVYYLSSKAKKPRKVELIICLQKPRSQEYLN